MKERGGDPELIMESNANGIAARWKDHSTANKEKNTEKDNKNIFEKRDTAKWPKQHLGQVFERENLVSALRSEPTQAESPQNQKQKTEQ